MYQARPSSRGVPRDRQSNNRQRSRPYSSAPRGGSPSRSSNDRNHSFSPSRDSRRSGAFRDSASSGGFRGGSQHNRSGGGRSQFDRPQTNRRRGGPRIPHYNISQFINKTEAQSDTPEIAVPVHQFRDFNIDRGLLMAIETRGYVTPSPIQDQTIPVILNGQDVVGLANTGSGKTGAFLIPLLNKVLLNPHEQVLILAPTRELALQIDQELRIFVRSLPSRTHIYSVVCVGGMNIAPQIKALRQHNHFVIGTPGRVMDLMERNVLKVNTYHSLVLDEADRMLDMGFIDDMRFVLSHMPKERHTLFFSATFSSQIERLIHEFLTNPKMISVKKRDTAKNIDQDVVRVQGRDKVEVLLELLRDPLLNKVIVFGETKHGVENLSKRLLTAGIKTESIHGNKSHNQRVRSLKNFTEGRARVLTATDVAARGLDIKDVSHVINFDLPQSYEDYIHRIGRTGRVDKAGKALTFIG